MKKIYGLLLIAIPLLWSACSKDDMTDVEINNVEEVSFAQRTSSNNPYNVYNMQMAYDYLVKEGRLNPEMFRDFSIKATHNYLKLKPATIEEEDLILADTTYIALDYPLDVDLPESYFERRGELAEGVIPEYYTSVKLGQKIAYNGTTEIIEPMYVPEEDPYFKMLMKIIKRGLH